MALTAIEWIVILFAVFGLIKLLVVSLDRRRWLPVIDEVYGHPKLFSIIFAILAILIFFVVSRELSLVQIMAVMALTWSLSAVALLSYAEEFKAVSKKALAKRMNGSLWVSIIIWALLFIGAIWTIFA